MSGYPFVYLSELFTHVIPFKCDLFPKNPKGTKEIAIHSLKSETSCHPRVIIISCQDESKISDKEI